MQSHFSEVTTHERSVFDRVPALALLLVGIAAVQVGAAFATKLFVHLGPAGTVLLGGRKLVFPRPNMAKHDAGACVACCASHGLVGQLGPRRQGGIAARM